MGSALGLCLCVAGTIPSSSIALLSPPFDGLILVSAKAAVTIISTVVIRT